MPKPPHPLRRHAWRLAMLLPAMLIALAGIQWLRRSNAQLYFADLNPAGTAFFSLEYESLGTMTQTAASVRDAKTGQVIADLSAFIWEGSRMLSWSSDGTKIVGVAMDDTRRGQSRVVVIEPSPSPRIVRSWENLDLEPLVVYFDRFDRVVFVQTPAYFEGSRPRLEIVANNSDMIRTVEYGTDEQAHAFMTRDCQTVNVGFYPNTTVGPNGDFVFTDGKQQALLRLDANTGEQVCLIRGRMFSTIYGISQLVSKHNATSKTHEIFKVDDLTKPMASFPESDIPAVYLDETRVLARDYSKGTVTIYDLESGQKRLLPTQKIGQLAPTANGHALATDDQGKLIRLNLDTGETTELLDLRAGMRVYRTLAIAGIPLLWMLWMYLGFRLRTEDPFLDMILLFFSTTLVAIFWSVFGLREFLPDRGTVLFGFISLGAFVLLAFIWASTSKSLWGIALPCGIVAATVTVGILLFWTQGDSYRVVEGLLGGVAVVFWQILGLAIFRRCFGVIHDGKLETGRMGKQSQLSLKQALITTAAFGLLFAILQFVDFDPATHFRGAGLFVVWLFTYVSVMVFASLAAMWSAFHFSNLFASGFFYLIVSGAFAASHFVVTRPWGVQLLWTEPVRYALPMAAGFLVWLALRYCRAHGYRLEKLADTRAAPC